MDGIRGVCELGWEKVTSLVSLPLHCIYRQRGTCDLSTIEIQVLFYIIGHLLKIIHIPVSAHHYSGTREVVIPALSCVLTHLCCSILALEL